MYVATPAPDTAALEATQAKAAAQQEAEAAAAEARRDNLLRRDRGRTGTIQTSFRGLLGQAAPAGTKKTLLGE
ncbi:MAG TPA: hypothetical protein DDX54_00990 [Rhodospirillaceae bacterium]|nr:hypothetical protein [Rhodospirillaceae bacterium]